MWHLRRYDALGDTVDWLQHQPEKPTLGAMSVLFILRSIIGIQHAAVVVPDGCYVACTLKFRIAASSHCISTAVSTASSSTGSP